MRAKSKRTISLMIAVVPIGLGLGMLSAGHAQNFGEVVTQEGPAERNVFLAGETVRVDTDAAEDVIAFGQDVSIGGVIEKDVLAAARRIDVDANIGGDLRFAAADLEARGEVGGDVMAAARHVRLGPDLIVGGRLWAAAAEAEIGAAVVGDARIAAGEVVLSGDFAGDVEVAAETLRVLADARIAGDLTYRSVNAAQIDPAARIAGDVIFMRSDATDEVFGGAFAGVGLGSIVFLVGLIVLGAAYLVLFPDAARAVSGGMRDRPWQALGIGALVLIGIPVLAVLLAVTFVGLPLTVFLAAMFVAALFAAYLSVALTLGQIGARLIRRNAESRFWPRLAALAVGLLVLAIVALIPLIGPVATVVALMFGLGALAVQVSRARSPARA